MKDSINILSEGQIDISKFLLMLWLRKYIIFFITVFTTFIILMLSYLLTDYYKSSALLFEKGQEESSASAYSGIASMAGISLPGQNEGKSDMAIELIKSRYFLKQLINKEGVLESLMAYKSFNRDTGAIIFDEEIYNYKTNKWKEKYQHDQGRPSYIEAHKIYLKNLNIYKDKINNFVTISYEHVSPEFAFEFLTLIIDSVNETMRKKHLNDSEKSLAFLYQKLEDNNSNVVETSISRLIEAEMQTQLRANISKNYVFDFIEPPFIPEKKSKPSRSLIGIVGFLFGFILAISYVLIANAMSKPATYSNSIK